MNTDDFEQRLQRQPLRQVPAEWREEILVAADVNRRSTATQPISEDPAALLAGWRVLFARLPVAWAALAALWIALIGVNLMLPRPIVSVATQGSPSAQMSLLATLDLQRAELELLGDQFAPAAETSPATEKPALPPRPHSQRRRDTDFGLAYLNHSFDSVT